MRSKILSVVVLLALVCSSCGGRTANPVMVQQYGDRDMSVESLEMQMAMIEQEIKHKLPQTDKTGKNIALGVTGYFLIVPLFFMDFSHAEQIEIDALRQRYNYLLILAHEKGGAKNRELIPAFTGKKDFKDSSKTEK